MSTWTPAERRAVVHYQRARRYGSDTDYTAADWQMLCAWFGAACLCCGATTRLTVDHVVPLVQGGSNTIYNLQVLCRSCNSRKGQRTVDYRDVRRLVQVLELIGG